ncbi:SsgA family sporulation/cell division regulator [Streptomyces sp. NPDC029006]|uniref:SsgA family sporulation/cell division regulator n=1 Tax=Streptomyces sp. NPDC029006 TaxID=3155467 RepID=UPI0033E35224
MESSRTVVQRVTAQLLGSHAYSLPLCMRVQYEPTDPYVVRAAFFPHSDQPVEWVLGRDLVAGLLDCPAGLTVQ